jgi:hypothetical protein
LSVNPAKPENSVAAGIGGFTASSPLDAHFPSTLIDRKPSARYLRQVQQPLKFGFSNPPQKALPDAHWIFLSFS